MDEIGIWNIALPPESINTLYVNGTSSNANVSASNLIAHYNFNSGTGNTLYDHSGNGNHGEIYGATWVDNNNTENPYIDYMLEFDGLDDLVSFPDNTYPNFNSNGEFTIQYQVVLDGEKIGRIVCYEPNQTGGFFIQSGNDNGGINFNVSRMADGANPRYANVTASNISLNVPVTVTFTYNQGEMNLYINGDKESSSNYTGPFADAYDGNLYFSYVTHDANERFSGTLDNVILLPYALSENEINEF